MMGLDHLLCLESSSFTFTQRCCLGEEGNMIIIYVSFSNFVFNKYSNMMQTYVFPCNAVDIKLA